MSEANVILTSIGPADVLHRLALGVEARDAISGQLLSSAVRAGQEVKNLAGTMDGGLAGGTPAWPCIEFESNGTGRFKLRHQIGGPPRIKVNPNGAAPSITVRLDDVSRRYVPRRFTLPLWTKLEIEAADPVDETHPATGPYVPLASRLLRAFLLPGAGYALPRGATALRGRVERNGAAVRWPRVLASGPGNVRVGAAHGDDRGEFVLLVRSTGTMPPPAPSTFDIDLTVVAPDPANPFAAPDPADRCADLVIESLLRSSNPATPNELDNDVLRGVATPSGYLVSTAPRPHVTVTVGELIALPQPVLFTP
jgi:hypothetical protein